MRLNSVWEGGKGSDAFDDGKTGRNGDDSKNYRLGRSASASGGVGIRSRRFCHGGERDCGKSDSSGEGKPYRAGQNIGEPCDDLKEEPK